MKETTNLQKLKVPTVLLAFFILAIWYFNRPVKEDGLNSTQDVTQEETKTEEGGAKAPPVAKTGQHQEEEHSHSDSEERFSYQNEVLRVQELVKRFPKSKPELLSIVIDKDIYKESNKEVKPHSISEIQQNQMGAVKVLALRELMSREQSDQALVSDLDYIIQNAKDPTIVKIAQAAKESVSKGRSFFDDFVDGLSDLEID